MPPEKSKQIDPDATFRMMRLIDKNPGVTQRALAKEAGISLGKTHYVLSALLERGYVKLENFGASKSKRAYAYFLTPRGFAEKATLARRFLARKEVEYYALQLEIEQLSAELGNAPE